MRRRDFLGGGTALPAALAADSLQAGAAAIDITPPLGSSIAGGMSDRIARDVADPLHARALAISSGAGQLGFLVVDSCMLPGDLIARAKQRIARHTGIAPDRTLIAANHTHSAPPAVHLFQSQPDPHYLSWLETRIADAMRLAVNRLEPARIGWGSGRQDKLVFHRRFRMQPGTIPPDPFGRTSDKVKMNPGVGNPNVIGPAGPVDPEVGLLGVRALDGRPVAAFASYALHYVGGAPGTSLSGDYFAAWEQSMRRRLNAPWLVGILANGCSANINNIDVRGPKEGYYPRERRNQAVADALAEETARVWRSLEFRDAAALNGSVETVGLGVRLPTAGDVDAARKLLAAAPRGGNFQEWPLVYARETVLMAETFPARVEVPVQALRIGGLGAATFPGEAFVELGLEVKRRSPFPSTFVIELANAYHGYIPTVAAHADGGYETWRAKSSYLETGAAPQLVEAALRRLKACG